MVAKPDRDIERVRAAQMPRELVERIDGRRLTLRRDHFLLGEAQNGGAPGGKDYSSFGRGDLSRRLVWS
jgi:hypothetical protein